MRRFYGAFSKKERPAYPIGTTEKLERMLCKAIGPTLVKGFSQPGLDCLRAGQSGNLRRFTCFYRKTGLSVRSERPSQGKDYIFINAHPNRCSVKIGGGCFPLSRKAGVNQAVSHCAVNGGLPLIVGINGDAVYNNPGVLGLPFAQRRVSRAEARTAFRSGAGGIVSSSTSPG